MDIVSPHQVLDDSLGFLRDLGPGILSVLRQFFAVHEWNAVAAVLTMIGVGAAIAAIACWLRPKARASGVFTAAYWRSILSSAAGKPPA